MRWHRLLRAGIFAAGLALGLVGAVFIFSNGNPVDLQWSVPSHDGPTVAYTLKGVSLWLVAVVPLLVGGVLGYFYQTPARMHHVREAFRHRHRVHELEKELKELRLSLDKVLAMPADDALALPAKLLPPLEAERSAPKVAEVTLPEEPATADLLADLPDPEEAKPAAGSLLKAAAKPARAAANGGRRRSRPGARRTPPPTDPEPN